MILGFTTFEFFANWFYYSTFFVFLNSVLNKRFSIKITYPVEVLLALEILVSSVIFPKMSLMRVFMLPVQIMVFNLILFKDKPLRSIFSAWLILVVIILSEYVSLAVLYVPEMLEGRLTEASMKDQILVWLTSVGSSAVMFWLISLIMNRVRNRFSIREMLMYSFFPVSQCLLLYGWMNATRFSGGTQHQFLVIVVMVLCLVADAGLFASMMRVSRQVELETENRFLTTQIGAQREHYAELTAQYEQIRRMRHDIAKHISAMDGLLAAGRHTEAAAYVAELRAESYNPTLGICENPVVDAFLHSAIQSAAEEGLVLDVSVSVPADISIASTDLVCTYGNLMDNAVEACAGVPGAVITLRTHIAAGYLITTAENPIGPNEGRKTRIQGLERGIGLRVLDDLAEKYNGSFRYQTDSDVFRAEITYRLDV